MTRTMLFCMFAPSPVSIKLPIHPNFAACRLRPKKKSRAIPQKSKIAAPSRMDGSSTRRPFSACCVLHLLVILPRVIRVLRVLRVLCVPVMCLSFCLWGRHYRATRAARSADPIESIVDLVGGRRRRE